MSEIRKASNHRGRYKTCSSDQSPRRRLECSASIEANAQVVVIRSHSLSRLLACCRLHAEAVPWCRYCHVASTTPAPPARPPLCLRPLALLLQFYHRHGPPVIHTSMSLSRSRNGNQ